MYTKQIGTWYLQPTYNMFIKTSLVRIKTIFVTPPLSQIWGLKSRLGCINHHHE